MFKNTTLAPRSCSAVDSHEPRMHSSDDDNAMHTHALGEDRQPGEPTAELAKG
jgi:hypothetical protein